MPSIGFCNLNDLYPDWNPKKVTNNGTSLSEAASPPVTPPATPAKPATPATPSVQNLLPDVPTFNVSNDCMIRNNNFQNQIAKNQFNRMSNPLDPYNQYDNPASPYYNPYTNNFNPYGSFPNPYQNPYLNMYDNYYKPNVRQPIFNSNNVWNSQRWLSNPNGPDPYYDSDIFNKGSSMYRAVETFANTRSQNDTDESVSTLKNIEKLLAYILYAFMVLIVLSVINIIK